VQRGEVGDHRRDPACGDLLLYLLLAQLDGSGDSLVLLSSQRDLCRGLRAVGRQPRLHINALCTYRARAALATGANLRAVDSAPFN